MILEAKNIAIEAHRGQFDKLGIDYFFHLQDVVKRVESLGEDYIILAWFHDILEDTSFKEEKIKRIFGTQIYEAVLAITKQASEDNSEYLIKVRNNPLSLKVKIADSSHNLAKCHLLKLKDPVKSKKLEQKYMMNLDYLIGHKNWNVKDIIFYGGQWTEVD